jgi:hypothetical protein
MQGRGSRNGLRPPDVFRVYAKGVYFRYEESQENPGCDLGRQRKRRMLKMRNHLTGFKMKAVKRSFVIFASILMVSLLCGACATYKATLKDQAFGGTLPDGTYTVIKYGANNSDDYATFAILVPERGKYAFDIYRPDYEYRTMKGVPASTAMQMAYDFVSRHSEFLKSASRVILAPDGSIAGYEISTLYRRGFLGSAELFHVTYLLKDDDRIDVRIRLDDVVLKHFQADND